MIEQLIVIAVFAICAVTCISILASSFFMAHDSSDTSRALIEAQSSAEFFKATGGDFGAVADMAGGSVSVDESQRVLVSVFYDRQWQVVSFAQADGFVLHITSEVAFSEVSAFGLVMGELSVSRVVGDSLVSFPLVARVLNV